LEAKTISQTSFFQSSSSSSSSKSSSKQLSKPSSASTNESCLGYLSVKQNEFIETVSLHPDEKTSLYYEAKAGSIFILTPSLIGCPKPTPVQLTVYSSHFLQVQILPRIIKV
jgi:hypothetical protein